MDFKKYHFLQEIIINPRYEIIEKYFDFTKLHYDPITKKKIISLKYNLDFFKVEDNLNVKYLTNDKKLDKYTHTDYKFCIRILQLELDLFSEQYSYDLTFIFNCLKYNSKNYKLKLYRDKNIFKDYGNSRFTSNNIWSDIDATHWHVKKILKINFELSNLKNRDKIKKLKMLRFQLINDSRIEIDHLRNSKEYIEMQIPENYKLLSSILSSKFRITNIYRREVARLLYNYLKFEVTKNFDKTDANIYVCIGHVLARLGLILDENKLPYKKLSKYKSYRNYLYQIVKSLFCFLISFTNLVLIIN